MFAEKGGFRTVASVAFGGRKAWIGHISGMEELFFDDHECIGLFMFKGVELVAVSFSKA